MNKGWIVWIVLVIILAVIAYIYTGFKGIIPNSSTTSIIPTTTVSANSTVPTTTLPPGTILYCNNFFMQDAAAYSNHSLNCTVTSTTTLGVWVYSGYAYNTSLKIVGANGRTYLSGSFAYNQTQGTFFSNVTLIPQNYTVILIDGQHGGAGEAPFIKFNGTTTAPGSAVYPYPLNGNFSNGQYTGWSEQGSGFGTQPLNITLANSNQTNCYYGQPWSNFPQTYFASTYTCGISVSPGNLTSSEFRVNPKTPFLNFRIVSPADSLIYVEVYQVDGNGTVTGHFNTLNISMGPQVSTEFANASLSLTTLTNKVVRIKVVSTTVQPQRYMAIGNFYMSSLPNTDKWISAQVNITR